MTFGEAVRILTPLFREFAGGLPSEERWTTSGSYRYIRALVGEKSCKAWLVLQKEAAKPPRLSVCQFSGPHDAWPAWKLSLQTPPVVEFGNGVVGLAHDPMFLLGPRQHRVDSLSVLLSSIYSSALELLENAGKLEVGKGDDEPTEVDSGHAVANT